MALPALLAVAVAQPVVVHRQLITLRSDAEMFVVFDNSLSMSARSAPQAPTRLERAKQELEQILPQLPDIPIGVATMTNRVLPNLMPTTDDALIERTINQSIAVNEPPSMWAYDGHASNLNALFPVPTYRLFSQSASHHSILVVFTDGESPSLDATGGYALAQELTIRPFLVHTWAPGERIYRRNRIDSRYEPDPQSGLVLQQFAQVTRGKVFAETDLSGLVRAIHAAAGQPHNRAMLLGFTRVPLGQWFVLAGVFPLAFLFWRRNL